MKPEFALSLSDERIDLLGRTPEGWAHLGAVDPSQGDLATNMAALRARALAIAPGGFRTKLVLPPSQVLFADIAAPGPDRDSRSAQIAAALEGRTPYRAEELVFDWSGKGKVVQVAVVARLTLDEAEGFAEEHDFAPVSFVTVPETGQFAGEPFFGPTKRQAAHLPGGDALDRDGEPVGLNLPELGTALVSPDEEVVPEDVPEDAPEAVPEGPAIAADEGLPEEDAASDAGPAAAAPAASATPVSVAGETSQTTAGTAAPAADLAPATEAEADTAPEEAPFAEFVDDADIFAPENDVVPTASPLAGPDAAHSGSTGVADGDGDAPDGGAAEIPSLPPGFASHRPAGLAGSGPSRLENITSRIQMAEKQDAPRLPQSAPKRSAPPPSPPLLRKPGMAQAPDSVLEAGDTLIRALDRVRAPVGTAEERARQHRNRGMLRNATGAAAVAFAAVVGLWWWYFETQTPAAPEAGIATAPAEVEAAPEPQVAASEPANDADAAIAPEASAPAVEDAPATVVENAATDPAAVQPVPETPGPDETAAAPVTEPESPAPTTEPAETATATSREPQPAGPNDVAPSLPDLAPAVAADPIPDASTGRPGAAIESAVTLPTPAPLPPFATAASDQPASEQPAPVAFGALQRFDADGNIVATAEGVRTPQGFVLYAGRPETAPPKRPEAIEALAAAMASAAASSTTPETADAATLPAESATGEALAPDEVLFAAPEPQELTASTQRPVARPAAIVPPAPPEASPSAEPDAPEAPLEAPAEPAPDDQAMAAPPPPDPATAARRPLARPAAIADAAKAATEPAPVLAASRYAVATSPSPAPRPSLLNRAVEQALAAALAEPSATAETDTAAASPEDLDEPEPESAAPDIPTKANVAKQATIANAIDLGDLSLIGIVGSSSRPRALVRTQKGKILTVTVGDKLDGGKVSGIGDGQLTYVKGGKTHVLKMTNKS